MSGVIDHNDPMYIHPSDHPGMIIVPETFSGTGFRGWRKAMSMALSAMNKIVFIDGSCVKPAITSPLLNTWTRCDNMVRRWICNVLVEDIKDSLMYCETARDVWDELERRYGQSDGTFLVVQGDSMTVPQFPSAAFSDAQRNFHETPAESSENAVKRSSSGILSEDMTVEILNKLPMKSLIRFSAGNKKWLDLIANPENPNSCRSLRLKASPSTLVGFFVSNAYHLEWRPIDASTPPCHPSFEDPNLWIKRSSNAFVIFRELGKSWGDGRTYNCTYIVADPFTNQRVELPPLRLPSAVCDCPLGFNCWDDVCLAHFRVVVVYSHYHANRKACQHCQIFTSEEPGWRDVCLDYIGRNTKPPVFTLRGDGLLHDKLFLCIDGHQKFLVSCDLAKGSYWDTDLPFPNSGFQQIIHLHVFQDYLLCGKHSMHKDAAMRVWSFEGDFLGSNNGDRWVLRYVIKAQDRASISRQIISDGVDDGHLSDDDIDRVEVEPDASFAGFHPCKRGIIFFTLKGDFMSYDVEENKLSIHGKGFEDAVACEWRPWPLLLPSMRLCR